MACWSMPSLSLKFLIFFFVVSVYKAVALDFSCSGRTDGYYADPVDPCSSRYFQCISGRVVENVCKSRSYDGDITEPTPVVDEFCKHRAAGNYPDPTSSCSQTIFTCSDEKELTIRWCAFDQYYEHVNDTCLPFEMVPGCIASNGYTPASTLVPEATTRVPVVPDPFCEHRQPGNYTDPASNCSQMFVTCTDAKKMLTRWCNVDHYFSAAENRCVSLTELPACFLLPGVIPAHERDQLTTTVAETVRPSTTEQHTSTLMPTTTEHLTSTPVPTTERHTTTERLTTTERHTTTERPTTERLTSTPMPTTELPTSTKLPTTEKRTSTPVPTTELPTTTRLPTTEQRTSTVTTEKLTSIVSTVPSTVSTTGKIFHSTESSSNLPVHPQTVEFTCKDRIGNFPDPVLPCSGSFYTCTSNHQLYKHWCNPELIFDPTLNMCNDPDFVVNCRRMKM